MSEREKARRGRFRAFMGAYYAARQADLLALESATALYAEYVANYGPPMHFKRRLTESRGQAR